LRLAYLTAAALVLAPLPAAHAATTCKSADLRYPFEPGGPKTFGVFKLRVTGGSCTTAHRVAKAWMKEFEAAIDEGHLKVPRKVAGYTFKTLAPTEAQSYNERGVKGATTIRFVYRVPNG
jgi:hypothetical protein